MKHTVQSLIHHAARRVASIYIKNLALHKQQADAVGLDRAAEQYGIPMKLAGMMQQRDVIYDIRDMSGRVRLARVDRLLAIEAEAKGIIKVMLSKSPALANYLVRVRDYQDAKALKQAQDEQKTWRPLPKIK